MAVNLNKYLWKFFFIYLLYYSVGMIIYSFLDYFLNSNSANDLVLVGCLCFLVPMNISKKFIKNEKRFFNEVEFKIMVNKCSLIASGITMFWYIVFVGYFVFLRIILTSNQLFNYIKDAKAANSDFVVFTMESPIISIICLLAAFIISYLLIKFTIGKVFKRTGIRYKTKTEKIAVENSN
jgi:hypothetical protein